MIDRSKQIIPDSDAVARCLDPEVLEILDLHGTFVLSELLEMLKGSSADCIDTIDQAAFIEKLTSMIAGIIQQGYSREYLVDKVSKFVKGSALDAQRDNQKINNSLLSGISCNLLQPDGKGWQKGKLKMCFEFIPEEPEAVAKQEKPVMTHLSSLDQIRQLSNELASAKATEQN
ncbi:KGK domain-containing protein [Chamaesiphon sp. VAR_48_metabat_135_sub]|uniref:KGK domain-containing protein n=1 Tax=Chamaesiphon sp. VAR_48_metabat_135_sub TaxID=2964699 RepID=UPI00286B65BD|nr:KGK domain-containing protein [Chamaesiphon sp. VAR_48_metabat_135_sub]